ncbi:MAG: hypothetical protein JXB32_07640 [Deltaproteobacteria bacterium]|nr:hypothetical protein [Deltaproteobacteria bacterium]
MTRCLPVLLLVCAVAAASCSGSDRRRTAPGDIGDPCLEEADCLPDLICRPEGVCGLCLEDSECVGEEMVCRADGTCADGGLGAACAEDTDCIPELVCGEDDTCRQRGLGDPCEEDDDCWWEFVCRSDGRCGPGGLDEPCTVDDDCRSDLLCRGDGRCGRPGLGDPCTLDTDCRTGLVCRDDHTCGPAGDTAEGEACTYTADCDEGLACLWGRDERGAPVTLCLPAGESTEGTFCGSTAECAPGLVCVAEGYGGRCTPAAADGDLGFPCTTLEDCAAGLACSTDGSCVRAAGTDGGPGYPLWEGVECEPRETATPSRIYFEVPRGPLAPGHDFFRLPWPNDIRKTADGHLDLSGFPHPATADLPVDVLDLYLRAAERDLIGYATNGAVFLRSSAGLSWDTLEASGATPTIYLVDLTTPALPTDLHRRLGFGWSASTGGGRYLCRDWLAVQPPRGAPYEPGRTYAVVLTNGVHDAAGNPMAQDVDFAQVVAPTRPGTEEALARAWDAYAPFRAYLAHDGIDRDSILVAVQFTTQNVPTTLRRAREVVETLPAPAASDLVRCSAGAASACDDGLAGDEHVRGCFAEDPAFFEVQGRFPTPVFQEGTAPYRTPADGGGFALDGSGRPVRQRDEPICFALSIPRGGPMPADGWPVVVVAHGTGGSYRSFVTGGLAADLAAVTLDDASVQRFAVLSFEAPQHGARRGGSAEDPELLFFNFANPGAAYGNVLQGAVDAWQAARLLAATDWDAAASPTGEAVRFDATRTYFLGHSQGATHGVPALPFDDSFAAAVLSGAGGSLTDSLLAKTAPYDVAGAVRIALADPDLGGTHPALTVFQTCLELADPVNYARHVVSTPFAPLASRHVLQIYGLRDTYSPKNTQSALAGALGLAIAEPVLDDLGPFASVALPASGNRRVGAGTFTAVLTMHDPPAGEDGHFVATRDDVARRRLAQFLGTAARDGVPTVVP